MITSALESAVRRQSLQIEVTGRQQIADKTARMLRRQVVALALDWEPQSKWKAFWHTKTPGVERWKRLRVVRLGFDAIRNQSLNSAKRAIHLLAHNSTSTHQIYKRFFAFCSWRRHLLFAIHRRLGNRVILLLFSFVVGHVASPHHHYVHAIM